MKYEIEIDAARALRWTTRTLAVLAVGAVLAYPARVIAAQLTVPNSFVSGGVISAAEFNANFAAVKAAVDDNDARIRTLAGAGLWDGFTFLNGGGDAFTAGASSMIESEVDYFADDLVGRTVAGVVYFKTLDYTSGSPVPAAPILSGGLVLDATFTFDSPLSGIAQATLASAITIAVDPGTNDKAVSFSFPMPALPATDSHGFSTSGMRLTDVTLTINGATTAQGEAMANIAMRFE